VFLGRDGIFLIKEYYNKLHEDLDNICACKFCLAGKKIVIGVVVQNCSIPYYTIATLFEFHV
jgi:hypothetical protein